ncbi:unnamed protein product [Rhizoctonia solani]|uniref:Peptidase C14 caspase domain-containing protein n=1 Tax=Rhizoctonia solani TaxID=456999 RepID=A0A8H3BX60_9AGAM|nr:unnamed protein product [Rhizoctonia solani]
MTDSIQFVLSVYVKADMVDTACRPGGHQQSDVTKSSRTLHKTLTGIPALFGPIPESIALLVTNEYKDRRWPNSDQEMTLRGAAADRKRVPEFLEKFGLTTGVKVEPLDNALRKNIVDRIEKIVNNCPPLLIAHFQGHGLPIRDTVQYITGDCKEADKLEGLTAEELIEMFSKLSARTTSVVITDFCFSGNMYRLRFVLVIGLDESVSWLEIREWENDNMHGRKPKIISHMIHIAGSLRTQQVYETPRRGGYVTNSLAHMKPEPMTLPQFLRRLRQSVNGHLEDARAHPSLDAQARAMFRVAEQVPQIFSNHKWPLDDAEIFSKIRLGTAKPSCQIFK